MRWSVFVFICSLNFACGQQFQAKTASKNAASLEQPNQPPVTLDPLPKTPVQPEEPEDLEICSRLNFEKVEWPEGLSFEEKNAFALALNITGSFEGRSGWTNLSNNFDGQGMSLGLLNQPLGQGSLQPLLYRFSVQHPSLGKNLFGQSRWENMIFMLSEWVGNLTPTDFLFQALAIDETHYVGAANDQDKFYRNELSGFVLQSARNKRSVQWAVENLYTDIRARNFKAEWKDSFKTMAAHAEYISLQVDAAKKLHLRAKQDFLQLDFQELRSYLFLFDIIVQNGGLRASHINEYLNYVSNNPNASEEERLLELLEIRVKSSLPQWRDDVRRRKRAIILGEGTVHGSERVLPTEYCYDQQMPTFGP